MGGVYFPIYEPCEGMSTDIPKINHFIDMIEYNMIEGDREINLTYPKINYFINMIEY